VIGITVKQDVSDIRISGVVDVIAECRHEYGLALTLVEALSPADAVILAVPHQAYSEGGWGLMRRLLKLEAGLIVDVKVALDRDASPEGVALWRVRAPPAKGRRLTAPSSPALRSPLCRRSR
jgi:UDP-N-acetyl-D-galactosamine dehydrogenase